MLEKNTCQENLLHNWDKLQQYLPLAFSEVQHTQSTRCLCDLNVLIQDNPSLDATETTLLRNGPMNRRWL